MSDALPGENYCLKHQGNHSLYAEHNCTVCRLERELAAAREELERLKKPGHVWVPAETVRISMQVFTFIKGVLIGLGFQPDSSSLHQLEIAYSTLRAAKEES